MERSDKRRSIEIKIIPSARSQDTVVHSRSDSKLSTHSPKSVSVSGNKLHSPKLVEPLIVGSNSSKSSLHSPKAKIHDNGSTKKIDSKGQKIVLNQEPIISKSKSVDIAQMSGTSTVPVTGSSHTNTSGKQGKVYTDQIIADKLVGYIHVHPSLWDHVPIGAHVRYIKKDDGSKKSRADRFKPGGFVQKHIQSNNKKMIMLETSPGLNRFSNNNYMSFPVAYDSIEELWKKYDRNTVIEIQLIQSSLAKKVQQINDLNQQVSALKDTNENSARQISDLTTRITFLENVLRNSVLK